MIIGSTPIYRNCRNAKSTERRYNNIATYSKHEQEFLVLYENAYKEYRPLILDANSKDECIAIIHARGIKAKAFFRISDLIKRFDNEEKLKWEIL